MYAFQTAVKTRIAGRNTRRELENYLAEIKKGNKDFISKLYRRTKAAVYGFALSILKNVHDSEDVLQETYIRIFNAADSYKPGGNPMPWILTIARNLALMKLREHKKTIDISEEDWEKISSENPSVTVEDRIVISAALEILSDEERQIVMLYSAAQLRHGEISEILHLPLATVISKYHRAIKKLRLKLQGSK